MLSSIDMWHVIINLGRLIQNKISHAFFSGGNISSATMRSQSMVLQRFPETASGRGTLTSPHPPPINVGHQGFHNLSPPIQGARSHNINVHPQVASASYRGPSSYVAHNSMNVSQDGLEMMPRHIGPAPLTGFGIYWSQQEGPMAEANLRQHNLPYLRVLPSDVILPPCSCNTLSIFVCHKWFFI